MNRDPTSVAARALQHYTEVSCRTIGSGIRSIDCDVTESPATVLVVLGAVEPTFPELDWVLTWDEVNGWASRVRTSEAGETVCLSYLGGRILPPPEDVGRYVRDITHGQHPGQLLPPVFRSPDAPDALEHELTVGAWDPRFTPPE